MHGAAVRDVRLAHDLEGRGDARQARIEQAYRHRILVLHALDLRHGLRSHGRDNVGTPWSGTSA